MKKKVGRREVDGKERGEGIGDRMGRKLREEGKDKKEREGLGFKGEGRDVRVG